jgi:hypothetical protein
MAEDGAFRTRKRCGSKLLSMALKSRAPTCGRSLSVKSRPNPKEGSANEKGLTFAASKKHAYSAPNP